MVDLFGVLAGGVVGSLLTQFMTGRREAKRLDREEAERRRREVSVVRSDWAAAFMDAYIAANGYVGVWRYVMTRRDPEVPVRMQDRAAALRDARDRVRGATARLLVVDTEPVVRAMAHALMISTESVLPSDAAVADVDRLAKEETDRLTALYLGFMGFVDMLAGIGDEATREAVVRRQVESSHLPAEVKQRLFVTMDASAAAKASADGTVAVRGGASGA